MVRDDIFLKKVTRVKAKFHILKQLSIYWLADDIMDFQ